MTQGVYGQVPSRWYVTVTALPILRNVTMETTCYLTVTRSQRGRLVIAKVLKFLVNYIYRSPKLEA